MRACFQPQELLDNYEECAFHHETFGDQYDVYYSWKYPSSPSANSSCDANPDASNCRRPDHRHRRRRWYLGVAKNGSLRTFVSNSGQGAASVVPRHRTMFVQRWTSRLVSALNHGPSVLPVPPLLLPQATKPTSTEVGGVTTSPKPTAGRSCSRLLRHCRHRNSRRQFLRRTPPGEQQQQQQPQQKQKRHGSNAETLRQRHRLTAGVKWLADRRATTTQVQTDPPDT